MNIDVEITKYMKNDAGRIVAVEYAAQLTHVTYTGVTSSTGGVITADLDENTTVEDMKSFVAALITGDENLISVHLSDLNFKYTIANSTPYSTSAEPTPEELRAQMQPISKRQLRLTLVRNGISLSELDTAILSMGDEAIIEWQDASEYRRLHPLLLQVAAYLELTPEQIDVMWQEALEA